VHYPVSLRQGWVHATGRHLSQVKYTGCCSAVTAQSRDDFGWDAPIGAFASKVHIHYKLSLHVNFGPQACTLCR